MSCSFVFTNKYTSIYTTSYVVITSATIIPLYGCLLLR